MRAIRLNNGSVIRFHDLPGQGRPLVFIHGLGCASSSDYPAVARNAALFDRRSILVDLLGYGFSDRPQDFSYTIAVHAQSVFELLTHAGVEKFDLFGHSMGGAIAIELASLCTQRVQNLVLSEPNLDNGGGIFSRAIQEQDEVSYVASGHAKNIKAAAISGSLIWAGTMQVAAAHAVHRSACSLVAGAQPLWREVLSSLPMRRTVIFGEHSLPDADFEQLPTAGIHVATVAQAGHSMAWENPAGLACAIAAACA